MGKFKSPNFFWVKALTQALRTGTKPDAAQKKRLIEVLSDETDLQTLNVDYSAMAQQLDIQLPDYQSLRQSYTDIDDKAVARYVRECIGS